MISKDIIRIASNTHNVGLNNEYSHKISLKNKIISMKYETESCIYCEASASLLSKKINKFNIQTIKNDFRNLKNYFKKNEPKIPKRFEDYKKLLNSDNLNRYNCIFLPFDAVIRALKL